MVIAVATTVTHMVGMVNRLSQGASTKGREFCFEKTANCLCSGPLPPFAELHCELQSHMRSEPHYSKQYIKMLCGQGVFKASTILKFNF
jgi:hypothetical protein